MTVILSTEELDAFSRKLSKWYNDQVDFVLRNLDSRMGFDHRDMRGTFDAAQKLMFQFEKENPKPDWRSLL